MKIVLDLSALTSGQAGRLISEKNIGPEKIIVHEAIVRYLEDLSAKKAYDGNRGIESLSELSARYNMTIIKSRIYHRKEELDSLARDTAYSEDALLCTTSRTQMKLAEAQGIRCLIIRTRLPDLRIEKFFTDTTMSVHLKENNIPYAKTGRPGSWKFKDIRKSVFRQEDIKDIAYEIVEHAKSRDDGFIEIERPGSTIVQLDRLRIVITRPPLSDGWEITAIKPVKALKLDDYRISEKLKKRLATRAEGILIAGAPGMGKSTFAAALAGFYSDMKKTVKTVEAPRDLVLPENITQYSISHADPEEIQDILLLSRPDYTIFDEIRNTSDFRLFADLRLAGIGFIGVVHATVPVDSIQRFLGRVELGVIPQVIDTVIFIKDGEVDKALSLKIIVKVPSGMKEQDLARPVVIVSDFETARPEFEIYTYGDETVVVPAAGSAPNMLHELAAAEIKRRLKKFDVVHTQLTSDSRCRVFVHEDNIPKIIGKQGKTISDIESSIGMSIEVADASELEEDKHNTTVDYRVDISSKTISFRVGARWFDKSFDIILGKDYLLTARASKKGVIKVKKTNKIGKIIADAINTGEDITLALSER